MVEPGLVTIIHTAHEHGEIPHGGLSSPPSLGRHGQHQGEQSVISCGPGLRTHLLSKDVWRPQSETHPEERGWKDPSLFPFLFLLLCLPVPIHKSRPDPMSLNRQEELWTECALPPALPSGPNTPSTPALTPPLRSSEAPTLNPFQSFPPFGPPQSKLSFPEPSIN